MKFGHDNDMTPDHSTIPMDIRIHLRKLTMIEEILLSPVLPVMSVFKLRTGQNIHRGYVANFRQESAALIDEVPRLANRIPVVIVKRCGQDNTSAECKVNRLRVQAVGQFLAQHHSEFSGGISLSARKIAVLCLKMMFLIASLK